MSPGNTATLTYLNFELEIGLGAGRSYPVTVLQSPAGTAQAMMQFPFDELVLQNLLKDLQIALLKSGGSWRRASSHEEQVVQTFGRALFDALFTGSVNSLYYDSQRLAQQRGQGLRLQLSIKAPELAALPWEFLADSREDEYLVLLHHTPVVRYLRDEEPSRSLRVKPPLRILGMVADPYDQPRLQVGRERLRVETSLNPLLARDLIELTWLEGQTWRDLQRAMRSGPWHIFHFIGHGGFDKNNDEGLLVLADDDDSSHCLPATQLARVLANHGALRLVLLSACQGAQGSSRDIFASTAATLARRGIPAVIAMQHEITDHAAMEFVRAFYEALADGLPVDAAVGEGRLAISLAVAHSVEWGTPVLFMRSADGMLFDLAAAPTITEMTGPPAEALEDVSTTGRVPPAEPPELLLTTAQKMSLVKRLLDCEVMQDRQSRDAVVDDLPDEVRESVRRSDRDREDVNAIVGAALNYPDGLASLIEVVRFFEADSLAMRAVDQALASCGFAFLVPDAAIADEAPVRGRVAAAMPAEPEVVQAPLASPEPVAAVPAEPQIDQVTPTGPEPVATMPAEPQIDQATPAGPEPVAAVPAEPEIDQAIPTRPEPVAAMPAEPEIHQATPTGPEPVAAVPAEPEIDQATRTGPEPVAAMPAEPEIDQATPATREPVVAVPAESALPETTLPPVVSIGLVPAVSARPESGTVPLPQQVEPVIEMPAPLVSPPTEPIAFDWVEIAAGEFLMGSDPTRDKNTPEYEIVHRLTLPTFRITRTLVTVAQFAVFVEATGYVTSAEEVGLSWVWTGSKYEQVDGASWQMPRGPGRSGAQDLTRPVTQVSWRDIQAFCRWAGVQLPSEAQWEKAARGTDGRLYPWGDESPDQTRCHFDPSHQDPTPVGQYPAGASPYGVLDLSGNLWERTRTLWGQDSRVPEFIYPYNPHDGREDLDAPMVVRRVLRSGSWIGPEALVRCAVRYHYDPRTWRGEDSFRVVFPGTMVDFRF